jgi:hypothetical protein
MLQLLLQLLLLLLAAEFGTRGLSGSYKRSSRNEIHQTRRKVV